MVLMPRSPRAAEHRPTSERQQATSSAMITDVVRRWIHPIRGKPNVASYARSRARVAMPPSASRTIVLRPC